MAPEPPVAVPAAAPQAGQTLPSAPAATTPGLRVLPAPVAAAGTKPSPAATDRQPTAKPLPTNCTRVSTTDPEAELARSKNGLIDLNYKDHRLVDDAYGVITAVVQTTANVADGTQLPALYEQHCGTTGLQRAQVTLAGDHHYGTANNYIFCAQEGVRAHLGQASANLEERGKLPLSQFVYEPELDRLRCPTGHYLVCHQHRPEEQLKVYLMADPAGVRPVYVAGAMHPIQAGAVDPAACAGGTGGSLASGGQQPGRAVQPAASAACDGGQLCRCREQSRGQAGPMAGIVAAKDPELVDCGRAEFANPAAPSSEWTGPGGGGRPGGVADGGRILRRSWADCMPPSVFGRPVHPFCRSAS